MYISQNVKELFGYEGKVSIVTGASSGIGHEIAKILLELGSEVYSIDIKDMDLPVRKHIKVDLSKRDSVNKVISGLPDVVNKVFCFAGVALLRSRVGTYSIYDFLNIHFTTHKFMIEGLLPRMKPGSSIVWAASTAGTAWRKRLNKLLKLVKSSSYEEFENLIREYMNDPEMGPVIKNYPYHFAKELIITYVKYKAWELASRDIRINSVSPGFTETPLLSEVQKILPNVIPPFMSPIGRFAKPSEVAWVAVFLNSDLASYVSGEDIAIDFGWRAAIETGIYPGKEPLP